MPKSKMGVKVVEGVLLNMVEDLLDPAHDPTILAPVAVGDTDGQIS